MKKAYLVDFTVLVRVVTDETDYDKIIELAAEKMKREYPVSELIENAADPVEDVEVPYNPLDDGWIMTDASDETLQLAKKHDFQTWNYREWVDKPGEPKLSAQEKIKDWDNLNWREEAIDLSDYSVDEMTEAIKPFGYELWTYEGSLRISINGNAGTLPKEQSIQLICECIFETN